jgi:hypothetical protein
MRLTNICTLQDIRVYNGRVTKEDEEAIGAAARRDLVLLVKEYTRQGYEQSYGGTDKSFEALWCKAFPANGSNTKPLEPDK